jgi:hypothetical protein
MTSVLHRIPLELILLVQWVLWRFEDRSGPKPTKVPYTCMGYKASVTNPEHLSKFEDALKFAARPGFCDGIGFVFTREDDYCGIDVDNCYPSDAAECAPWAMGILDRFRDTYGETSPSGSGYKIWCKAKAPRSGNWAIAGGAIEIYDRARFFTVTGQSNGILAITDHQQDIEALVRNLDEGRRLSLPCAIPESIPYGVQHRTLVSLAGSMWHRGMCAAAIEAALQVVNAEQCEKPGPPENITKIVKGMQKWPR